MKSDEQEIRDLVGTWMSATKTGDIKTVLRLMADDVVFLLPGHPPMIGKSAFAAAAQSQSNQPAPEFDGASEIEEVEVLGDWRSRRRHSQGGHTAYRRSADQKTRRIRLYDSTIYRSDRTEMRAGNPLQMSSILRITGLITEDA